MANYARSQRPWTRLAVAAIASALMLAAMPLAASAQETSTASAGGAFTVGSGGGNGNTSSDTGSATTNGHGGSTGYAPFTPASSPTNDQYLDVHTKIQTSTNSAPTASGGLPFTGFDVGIVALVGAALLGLGLTIRRLGTRDA